MPFRRKSNARATIKNSHRVNRLSTSRKLGPPAPLNVQYLLTKKLTKMPATVAMNHVRWPWPRYGAKTAETSNPTARAITETVRNCGPLTNRMSG